MSLLAGLYASSSSTFLLAQYLHNIGWSLQNIFLSWLGLFLAIHIPRLIFLTPDFIPKTVENFSVLKNNYLWSKAPFGANDVEAESGEKFFDILKDYRIYLVFVGYSAFRNCL